MTRTAIHSYNQISYLSEAHALPLLSQWAIMFAVSVSKWSTNRNTRLALRQLSPEQLKDVGLTFEQAQKEAARPFWL